MQDGGDYMCQVATMNPIEITHNVEILGKNETRAMKNFHFCYNCFNRRQQYYFCQIIELEQ